MISILSHEKLFFWTLEIIVLSLPVLFFVVYVSHLQGQQFAIDEGNIQKRIDEMDKISKSERNLKFWRGYVAMTIARTVFGAGMLYAYFQIYVFKMEMPDRYVCDRVPCQELTTCYIDRPRQKTFVIWIMVTTSAAINLLNFFDLALVLHQSCIQRSSVQKMNETKMK